MTGLPIGHIEVNLADIKSGDPFGMEAGYLAQIDWDLACKRIIQDVRSDFIYAPHLNFIYSKAGPELTASLISDLKGGNYSPGIPLSIEVPKSFRIRVAAQIKRLGRQHNDGKTGSRKPA